MARLALSFPCAQRARIRKRLLSVGKEGKTKEREREREDRNGVGSGIEARCATCNGEGREKKEREREENTRGTCVLQRRDLENKIVLQTRSAFVLYIIDRSATSDRPWENAKGVFGSFGKRPTTGETRQGWEKLVRLVYICMYPAKGVADTTKVHACNHETRHRRSPLPRNSLR